MNGTLVDVLLALGVVAQLVCVVGCVAMRNVFDRLHYVSAGTTLGPILILSAILGKEGLTSGGLEAIAAIALLFLANPIVVHATARAARSLDFGDVEPKQERPE